MAIPDDVWRQYTLGTLSKEEGEVIKGNIKVIVSKVWQKECTTQFLDFLWLVLKNSNLGGVHFQISSFNTDEKVRELCIALYEFLHNYKNDNINTLPNLANNSTEDTDDIKIKSEPQYLNYDKTKNNDSINTVDGQKEAHNNTDISNNTNNNKTQDNILTTMNLNSGGNPIINSNSSPPTTKYSNSNINSNINTNTTSNITEPHDDHPSNIDKRDRTPNKQRRQIDNITLEQLEDDGTEVPEQNSHKSQKVTTKSKVMCKYSKHCKNINCPYNHPKQCSFSYKCYRLNCKHIHPKLRTIAKICKDHFRCTNNKCHSLHEISHLHPERTMCKYNPECRRLFCPFKHDDDIARANELYKCHFHPCINPKCPYEHDQNQRRSKLIFI